MIKNLKRFFAGLLILPFTAATIYHLPSALLKLQTEVNALALIFSGAVFYVCIEAIFERPMRTYIFGHELTHALASIAFGGRVERFNVSEKGGSVTLTKTNFIVALAPYCLPIYTVFLVLAYAIIRRYYPGPNLDICFLALLGSSLTFHGSLTLYALRQNQPDIKKTGTFFSLVFILLVNAWVVVILSKFLFWKNFAAWDFVTAVLRTQGEIWRWVWVQLVYLVKLAHDRASSRKWLCRAL